MRINKTISILGCGWLGLPLAKHFKAKGYTVKGSTTTEAKLTILAQEGIQPFLINITDKIEGNFADFVRASNILVINFPPKRVPNIVDVYPRQMEVMIEQLSENQKVIFISSTSVYQNMNGEVTEELELHPEKDSGKALVKAEQLLQTHLQNNLTTIRLAGLVGYDRLPGRFLANKKDVKNGDAPINVIHRDDCIGLIDQVIEQEKWGELYNGCADLHPMRRAYYIKAAAKIGLVPPTFAEEEVTEYKVVSNQKAKQHLGFEYKYPDPIQML